MTFMIRPDGVVVEVEEKDLRKFLDKGYVITDVDFIYDIKEDICNLAKSYHFTNKEIDEKTKSKSNISYEMGKEIFTEESGAFCKNKKTGKIRFNPNYWKDMFVSPDRPECDWEKEDMIMMFHTHPIGYPIFSSSDLKVAIQYDIWSCVGAGTPYNKRIICIKPKHNKRFDDLMKKLYGDNWETFIKSGKIHRMITSYDPLPYKKMIPEIDDTKKITIEDSSESIKIIPNNEEKKRYLAKKKWIKKSGLFDMIEFECKCDNDVCELIGVKYKTKKEFNKTYVKELIRKLYEYYGNFEMFYDPVYIENVEESFEYYDYVDIHGIVTYADVETEIKKFKSFKHRTNHCHLIVEDETGEIDVIIHQYYFNHKLVEMIRNDDVVGNYVFIKKAKLLNEDLLEVSAENVHIYKSKN